MKNAVWGCGPCGALPIAMTYMPIQVWRGIYAPCDALQAGTLFAELDLPFYRKGGVCP